MQDAVNKGWFRKTPVSRDQPPDMEKVIDTALEIANGMAYLHARGIVHGDLTGACLPQLAPLLPPSNTCCSFPPPCHRMQAIPARLAAFHAIVTSHQLCVTPWVLGGAGEEGLAPQSNSLLPGALTGDKAGAQGPRDGLPRGARADWGLRRHRREYPSVLGSQQLTWLRGQSGRLRHGEGFGRG